MLGKSVEKYVANKKLLSLEELSTLPQFEDGSLSRYLRLSLVDGIKRRFNDYGSLLTADIARLESTNKMKLYYQTDGVAFFLNGRKSKINKQAYEEILQKMNVIGAEYKIPYIKFLPFSFHRISLHTAIFKL